jgi:putative molybdopterin biosynthesis protein
MKQQQFLNLATAEEAEERFWEAVHPQPLGEELVLLEDAHGRILAGDIVARHNVPYFDRSNFDGLRCVRKTLLVHRKQLRFC